MTRFQCRLCGLVICLLVFYSAAGPLSFAAGRAVGVEPGILQKMKAHLIETLDRLPIDDLSSFRIEKGVIKGKVYGIPLAICKLCDLPLLDSLRKR